jgi:excisionase family DNA binding protein
MLSTVLLDDDVMSDSADTKTLARPGLSKKSFTTSEVGKMLGMALQSVSNWIDAGQLRAGRTPGGHRRVQPEDLLDFLRKQGLAIPAELQPSPPKVLIVDDEEAVVSWVAAEIRAERPDIEVLVARDGFSAGEIVGFERPDVVVLDLRMPGIDGFEVCRRIKDREETRKTTVIAMTAYPSPKSEQRILECGAEICLTKSLEANVLLKHVTAALAVPTGPGECEARCGA